MANVTLTVGKVRTNIFTVNNADGSVNSTLSLNAFSGNDNNVRVRVNPSNNREVGIMALIAGAANNATVQASLPGGVKQVQDLVSTVAAPVNQEALTAAGWSAEIDPPAWML